MFNLHSLLRRQLKRHAAQHELVLDNLPELISSINNAYRQFDEDRAMLERSLELSSVELIQANAELRAVLQALPDLFLVVNHEGLVLECKAGASDDLILPREQLIGRTLRELPEPRVAKQFAAALDEVVKTTEVSRFEYQLSTEDGMRYYESRLFHLPKEKIMVMIRNITKETEDEQQGLYSHKLQAIGQLAAGIAHEINTPVQYISDNIKFLADELTNVTSFLSSTLGLVEKAKVEEDKATLLKSLSELGSDFDIDFLKKELPIAIQHANDGIRQVAAIVSSMREFAHPGGTEKSHVDINHSLRSTVAVSSSQWKSVAKIEMDLDPNLPLVTCYGSDLRQVFLNIVVNAAQAIQDKIVADEAYSGKISIATKSCGSSVEITFEDNGSGIPENIQSQIFNPFFTTKKLGRGTGQGLAIAHSVIVNKHNGKISTESEVGKGTCFRITLPVLSDALSGLSETPD